MPQLLSGSPIVAARAVGLVNRQAAMIAYIDNFLTMVVFTLAALPLVLLLCNPKSGGPIGASPSAVAD